MAELTPEEAKAKIAELTSANEKLIKANEVLTKKADNQKTIIDDLKKELKQKTSVIHSTQNIVTDSADGEWKVLHKKFIYKRVDYTYEQLKNSPETVDLLVADKCSALVKV